MFDDVMDAELTQVRDFLAAHAPFDALPRGVLDGLSRELTARYFRRGTTLVRAGQPNDSMYVLRSGAVDILDAHGALVERSDVGTSFGMSSVMSGGPSRYTMVASEDTLVYLMPAALFHELIRTQPEFARFFMQQQAGRLRSAVETVQVADSGTAVLKTRVSDIVRRAPVTAAPATSIRDAAVRMSEERVSALLITEDERMVGIVTDRDLRSKVVAAGRDCTEPVSEIMTPDPISVGPDALAFEVLMEMTQRGVHHLPVVERDRPVGMITAGDLMRLEQTNPVFLVGDIGKRTDLDGLVAAASRLGSVVSTYVEQDASADDIGRLVTTVGDALVRRLLNFAEAELGPPPVHYCWVALGSQARLEQGLGSDQDSALLLADDVSAAHAPYFAALADRVVAGLEACGYPRCPGDMMASNPQWRQPVGNWQRLFTAWVNEPRPDALLNAQTFFDMRPLYGDRELFAHVQATVTRLTPGANRFLAHLAKQAIDWSPPLGFFRGFVLSGEGDQANTLDLKAGGIAAIVQTARVLALSKGLSEVNTSARLTAAAAAGAVSDEEATNLIDAFEFISYVRLRHQAKQHTAGEPVTNRVDPAQLSAFEKRHLRDAFETVRRAQGVLGHTYRTDLLS